MGTTESARRLLLAGVVVLGSTVAVVASPGDDRGDPDRPFPPSGLEEPEAEPEPPEMSPEVERAVLDGLAWLASTQSRSGRFPSVHSYHIAVTSLAGLAFLAHGEAPERGPHAQTVRRALEFVLDSQMPSGLYFDHGKLRVEDRPMHGHGFAMHFVAEASGQTRDPALRARCRASLREAVRCTAGSISPEGGWHYFPDGQSDEGSVTVTQIQGLRAAREVGIEVPKALIDRATDYLRRSQQRDSGGVRYSLARGSARTTPALTAAGMVVLYGAGTYEDEALDLGFRYLRKNMDDVANPGGSDRFFYYTHFYAAQAFHARGGDDWDWYWKAIREEMMRRRGEGPCWESQFGRPYATALALLTLQVPFRYLPTYER